MTQAKANGRFQSRLRITSRTKARIPAKASRAFPTAGNTRAWKWIPDNRNRRGIEREAAGYEEILHELAVCGADLLQDASHRQVLAEDADALVAEQGQILDPEEEPEHKIIDDQTEHQEKQHLQRGQQDPDPLLFVIQRGKDQAEQREGGGHGKIGLVGPHRTGQKQDAGKEAEAIPDRQPDGQHRQQDAKAVGRGCEQVQVGESYGGEDDHQHPDQPADPGAPHPDQGNRKGRGQGEKEHGEEADQRGRLQKTVPGSRVVQEPAAGDRHLLRVRDPGDPVGIGKNVRKGKEMDEIACQKAADKGGKHRPRQRTQPPHHAGAFQFLHSTLPFFEDCAGQLIPS